MEDLAGIIAIVMVFGIPMVAILSGPIKQALAQRERREARALYERLTMEKLDVIKTAVAMGMEKTDLADLDTRLERLIGADEMQTLLMERPALPDMLDQDAAAGGARRRSAEAD